MARTRPQLPDLGSLQAPTQEAAARGQFSRSAYDVIRGAILECRLLPGVALSEVALAEQLGISRAPVREALRQLASEHLVEVIPQRGSFVALLDADRIRDAIFVREVIECRAAALAAKAPVAKRRELKRFCKHRRPHRGLGITPRTYRPTKTCTAAFWSSRVTHMRGLPCAWRAQA